MRKLIEGALLRKTELTLGDEVIVCREPSATVSMQFSEKLKLDRDVAMAWLIVNHCERPDGSPAFSQEEADTIASGSARVLIPLFTAITGGGADPEKKASPTRSDSDTASPPPSGDPSPN